MDKRILKKDEVLARAGDIDKRLYLIESGELLICALSGSMITPLAYLRDGEFVGELSFFDGAPRSAYIIALKETTLVEIPEAAISLIPNWLITMAKNLTAKIRKIDALIATKGIKRKGSGTLRPLSIEEQRHFYLLLKAKG